MHLRHQPERVDLFPTEVRGGGDAGMSQELVGGLYDPVAQGVGNVEALARDSFFWGLETPDLSNTGMPFLCLTVKSKLARISNHRRIIPVGDSRDRIQVSAWLSVRKMNGLCKR